MAANAAAAASKHKPAPSLIKKYHLEKRVASGKDSEESLARSTGSADGKGRWEATAEKRQDSLRERKAQMIMAARKYVSHVLRAVRRLTPDPLDDYKNNRMIQRAN